MRAPYVMNLSRTGPLWDAPRDSDPLASVPNVMISKRDGGPARTRTWDQGIMSNRIPSLLLLKAEEA
jgi:hypothetical protein